MSVRLIRRHKRRLVKGPLCANSGEHNMSASMQGVLVDLPVFHDQFEIPVWISDEL